MRVVEERTTTKKSRIFLHADLLLEELARFLALFLVLGHNLVKEKKQRCEYEPNEQAQDEVLDHIRQYDFAANVTRWVLKNLVKSSLIFPPLRDWLPASRGQDHEHIWRRSV